MKQPNPRVTFESDRDAVCLAEAMLGQSNKAIMLRTGLSSSQITYRLHKAKTVQGNEHGYRVAWRNGESDLVKRIKRDVVAVLKKDIQRTLPVQIAHPTPEMVAA